MAATVACPHPLRPLRVRSSALAFGARDCRKALPTGVLTVPCALDQEKWNIKDTSTNGTFVNGTRVAKNGVLPLAPGDLVRLSQPQGNDPSKLLE